MPAASSEPGLAGSLELMPDIKGQIASALEDTAPNE